jgi:hypothetical protein
MYFAESCLLRLNSGNVTIVNYRTAAGYILLQPDLSDFFTFFNSFPTSIFKMRLVQQKEGRDKSHMTRPGVGNKGRGE